MEMSDFVSAQSGRTDTDIPLKGCPVVRRGMFFDYLLIMYQGSISVDYND